MNNLGKAIGLILFMGIILTSCLLLVSKPKDQVVTITEFPQDGVKVSKVAPISEFERNQITISVMHELDSLDNIYRVEAGMQKIPAEVFDIGRGQVAHARDRTAAVRGGHEGEPRIDI